MRTVAVRLPDGVIKIIDELCSDLGESRAKVLREILMEGIKVLRLRTVSYTHLTLPTICSV